MGDPSVRDEESRGPPSPTLLLLVQVQRDATGVGVTTSALRCCLELRSYTVVVEDSLAFLPKKFCKIFQISRHIESLNTYMKY